MKRNIAALAVIASLATGSLATSANAMGTELNMLTGAIFNELVSRNIATDNIQELTISQLAQIKGHPGKTTTAKAAKPRTSRLL